MFDALLQKAHASLSCPSEPISVCSGVILVLLVNLLRIPLCRVSAFLRAGMVVNGPGILVLPFQAF